MEKGNNVTLKKLQDNRRRAEKIYESTYYYSPEFVTAKLAIKKQRNKRIKTAAFTTVILLMALSIFAAICYSSFFKLNKIAADGTGYTQEQIETMAGVRLGTSLYGFSRKQVSKNLTYALPYAADVKVLRIWPSTLKIKMNQNTGAMYTALCGNYYVISEDLDVLECTDDIEKIESQNLLRINFSDLSRCIVGEKLRFSDEHSQKIVNDIYKEFKSRNMLADISEINIISKFDIEFTYQKRFTVKLGDAYDIPSKLDFMNGIVKLMYENDGGIIDVSDRNLKEGVVSPY